METNSKYRYFVLIILTVVSFLNIADRLVVSILIEDIKTEFAFSDTQIGLLVGIAFALFYALMGIPIARMADRFNRRNIVAISLILWSGMMALCGAAVGFVSFFLSRLGVGVGEAGGGPPSYSMIADYFKPSELARAMGIYMTGAVLGTAGGLMVGGFLADLIGWRLTFVAMGLPGIALGIFMFFTIREPARGVFDKKGVDSGVNANISETLKSLMGNKVYVRISIAFAVITVIGYAMAIWLAPIMIRNFDVSLTRVGLVLGSAFLIAGVPGTIAGGYITDYLAKTNQRWYAWFGAIMILVAGGFYMLSLTSGTFLGFIGFFVIGYFFYMMPQGSTLSILQSSVKSGERALAVAFALLFNNILGMAIGPAIVGALSDVLKVEYGIKSINYSVLSLCAVAAVVGCLVYIWTAAAMKPKLEEVKEVV